MALLGMLRYALGWYMLWRVLLTGLLSDPRQIADLQKQLRPQMAQRQIELVPLAVADGCIRIASSLLERLREQQGEPRAGQRSSGNKGSWHWHPALLVGATVVGTLGVLGMHRRLAFRCRTAADIPPAWFKQRRRLHCLVLAANDSDNLRCLHLSWYRRIAWALTLGSWRPARPSALSAVSINVRLAGIDAPELGHFGAGPAQPLAHQAQQWLAARAVGRRVVVELQRADQYGRAVGLVYGPQRRWLGLGGRRCLNVDMLSQGLACVYRLGGSEYGAHRAEMERAEALARSYARGMWGLKQLVSPSEYKKRSAANCR